MGDSRNPQGGRQDGSHAAKRPRADGEVEPRARSLQFADQDFVMHLPDGILPSGNLQRDDSSAKRRLNGIKHIKANRKKLNYKVLVGFMQSALAEDPELQKEGCIALAQMCTDSSDAAEAAAAEGGFEAVLLAIKNYKTKSSIENLDVLAAGFEALNRLCAESANNRAKAADQDAVELVTEVLCAHYNNHRLLTKHTSMQAAGCWALHSMCYECDANLQKAAAANAVKEVVRVIETLSITAVADKGEDCHREGCCMALYALCVGSSDNKKRAANADAIKAVVNVLQLPKYHKDVKVRKAGFYAIHAMCSRNDDNKEKAGAAGAIEAVLSVLKGRGDKDRGLLLACFYALDSMCIDNRPNQDKAGKACVDAVLQAMRAAGSAGDFEFQKEALKALRGICAGNESNTKYAASEYPGFRKALSDMAGEQEAAVETTTITAAATAAAPRRTAVEPAPTVVQGVAAVGVDQEQLPSLQGKGWGVSERNTIIVNGDDSVVPPPSEADIQLKEKKSQLKKELKKLKAAPKPPKRFYVMHHSQFSSRWMPFLCDEDRELLELSTYRVVTFGVTAATSTERLNGEFACVPRAFGYPFNACDARLFAVGFSSRDTAGAAAAVDGRDVEREIKALLKLAKKRHKVGEDARKALHKAGVVPFDHPACAVPGAAPGGIMDETLLLREDVWHKVSNLGSTAAVGGWVAELCSKVELAKSK